LFSNSVPDATEAGGEFSYSGPELSGRDPSDAIVELALGSAITETVCLAFIHGNPEKTMRRAVLGAAGGIVFALLAAGPAAAQVPSTGRSRRRRTRTRRWER
jgi:hypothetical protein